MFCRDNETLLLWVFSRDCHHGSFGTACPNRTMTVIATEHDIIMIVISIDGTRQNAVSDVRFFDNRTRSSPFSGCEARHKLLI